MKDRGRLPFALVGVLLLVSSVTLTATVGVHDPERPATERALDGAIAESTTILRGVATDAAAEAAAAPVTQPANTTAGRALSDNRPFRDALRLRIYLTAYDRLEGVGVRRGGVVVDASLPPVEATTEGYREAIERVRIERTGGDDAAVRIEIDGVELTAMRDGRIVERLHRSPSFVTATPVLSMHDRTEQFQRRLDAGVTDPGLARRLTARLYPLAWTRGFAQYGGAPITNVVGTRHVELATNDALVAEQRAAFGVTDPAAERGVAAAGRRVATTDLVVAAGGDEQRTDEVLEAADAVGSDRSGRRPIGTWREKPDASDLSIEVGGSADRAYAATAGIDAAEKIDGISQRAHTVESRLSAEVTRLGRSRESESTPADDWNRDGATTRTRIRIERASVDRLDDDGWATHESRGYRATETVRTTRTWRRGNDTKTTRSTVETHYRVVVAVQLRAPPIRGAPAGRLDGALQEAVPEAADRAVAEGGGFRTAVRRAVSGSLDANATARIDPTIGRDRLVADLRKTRERTRSISVSVSGPAVGAGRINPPGKLREEVGERRSDVLGDGGRSPTERTRIGVRAVYLDALDDELAERAERHAETSDGVADALDDHTNASGIDGALFAHRTATRPDSETVVDPAGNRSLALDASPSYLTTSPLRRDRIDVRGGGSVHPLATRNVNVFTSPHGQVTSSVIGRIPYLGTDRVPLSTAAETLESAEPIDDDSAIPEREQLEADIEESTTYVRGELVAALSREGVSLEDAETTVATEASTHADALALTNGTATDRIVAETTRELNFPAADRDRLRVRLETTLEDALADDAARPSRPTTKAVADGAKETYRKELESIAEDGVEAAGQRSRTRVLGERMGSLPAGLPLAPVPGYWYATTNVWYVEAGGRYERFVVRANRGNPTGATTYIRDGRPVWVDHDGDRFRLGTAERLSFRISTVVVVVVPPGGAGVGDTDGVGDERSPGWPPDTEINSSR